MKSEAYGKWYVSSLGINVLRYQHLFTLLLFQNDPRQTIVPPTQVSQQQKISLGKLKELSAASFPTVTHLTFNTGKHVSRQPAVSFNNLELPRQNASQIRTPTCSLPLFSHCLALPLTYKHARTHPRTHAYSLTHPRTHSPKSANRGHYCKGS